MYRVIVICVHLMPTEQSQPHIALRDENFIGEDKEIAKRLKKMAELTSNVDVKKIVAEISRDRRFRERARSAAGNVKRPGPRAARRYNSYPNDPDNFRMKVNKMMKQVIYMTQQRLKDMEPAVKKYEKDERLRLAFIMCTLDEWVEQMYIMYTILEKTVPRDHAELWRELMYYQHFTKKHLDIIYTVEDVIELYEAIIVKIQSLGIHIS